MEKLECEECGVVSYEGNEDYSCIYQTGLCGCCLIERIERREEW
ncbi:hypothetical protein GUT183_01590 [Streptococcus ruminantium]|nr:hypothetical protein GUT183_01590 [Streptococcus ruminantium]